jgi:hypothetical protein
MKTSTEISLFANYFPIDNFLLGETGNVQNHFQKNDLTRQNSTQEIQSLSGFQPIKSITSKKDKYGENRYMFSPIWVKTHQNINFI